MTDIFLSYSRDDESQARQLANCLAARGWSVFWDRQIPPGETWREWIHRALEQAGCVVVLWSSASVKSQWVLDEAGEGVKRGNLVPARIEPIEPPLGFRQYQAADLLNWTGDTATEGYQHLLDAVAIHLAQATKYNKNPTYEHDNERVDRPRGKTSKALQSPGRTLITANGYRVVLVSVVALVTVLGSTWGFYEYFHSQDNKVVAPEVIADNGNTAGSAKLITENLEVGRYTKLARELGLPEIVLSALDKNHDHKGRQPDDLDKALRASVKRYKEINAQLQSISSDDTAVVALKRQADNALELAELDKAEKLLNEARDKYHHTTEAKEVKPHAPSTTALSRGSKKKENRTQLHRDHASGGSPVVTGDWRNPLNPNSIITVSQHGDSIEIQGRGSAPKSGRWLNYSSSGSGRLIGSMFYVHYRTRYENGLATSGDCDGVVAADNTKLYMKCRDGSAGATAGVLVRQH